MEQTIDSLGQHVPDASAPRLRRWRELASRQAGAISVGLYWDARDNQILVHVMDQSTGESFVPP